MLKMLELYTGMSGESNVLKLISWSCEGFEVTKAVLKKLYFSRVSGEIIYFQTRCKYTPVDSPKHPCFGKVRK
jgi:hypothetical protein